jgi:hypothetical protein
MGIALQLFNKSDNQLFVILKCCQANCFRSIVQIMIGAISTQGIDIKARYTHTVKGAMVAVTSLTPCFDAR